MAQPAIDANKLPLPAALSQQEPDPSDEVITETPPSPTFPAAVKPENDDSPSVNHPQKVGDENHSVCSEDEEQSPANTRGMSLKGSNNDSAHDRAIPQVTENFHDLDGASSHEPPPVFSHVFRSFLHRCSLVTSTLQQRTAFV